MLILCQKKSLSRYTSFSESVLEIPKQLFFKLWHHFGIYMVLKNTVLEIDNLLLNTVLVAASHLTGCLEFRGVSLCVANSKRYIKGSGDKVSSCRRTISTNITVFIELYHSQVNRTFRDHIHVLILVCFVCVLFYLDIIWKPEV